MEEVKDTRDKMSMAARKIRSEGRGEGRGGREGEVCIYVSGGSSKLGF